MKFRNEVDVSAPIEVVFAEASDFELIEKLALKRGIDVQRLDVLSEPGPGMVWDVAFNFRGKMREMEVELVHYDPTNEIRLKSRSSAFMGTMDADFLALSRQQTRVSICIEMKPQNLTARLMMQSVKLMRANLIKRLRKRMKYWARLTEDRHKAHGPS
ncbi:SRPBCC family protein [Roseovarius sp. EL26]|uniref:SRPBCC family protein n=1 Tax=Roseovarius sp. EL26 TaxID=2126672 RepID=UPI000EA37EAD|nr:SRPBCC family protein [Roseovarius sp. EL26]